MGKKGVYLNNLINSDLELDIKKHLLFFDKLYVRKNFLGKYIDLYDRIIEFPDLDKKKLLQNINDLEYLYDKKILEELSLNYVNPYNDEQKVLENEIEALKKKVQKRIVIQGRKGLDNFWRQYAIVNGIESRRALLSLYQNGVRDVYPIVKSTSPYEFGGTRTSVLKYTLNKFPFPKKNTSLEEILCFKNDPSTHGHYLALINWINNVSSSNKSLEEIEDEYNYLYDQYSRHFKLHEIKISLNTWELLIGIGLDVISSLPSLGVLKPLFEFRKSKLHLLESEMKLPGREIAYIYHANKEFD